MKSSLEAGGRGGLGGGRGGGGAGGGGGRRLAAPPGELAEAADERLPVVKEVQDDGLQVKDSEREYGREG